MTARTETVSRTALARARERRRELDRDRDQRDQRIEVRTARVLVALAGLVEAEAARDEATATAGAAIRDLLAEDVTPERAAALVDAEVTEIRRLAKVRGSAPVRLGPDQAGNSEDAPRRAG